MNQRSAPVVASLAYTSSSVFCVGSESMAQGLAKRSGGVPKKKNKRVGNVTLKKGRTSLPPCHFSDAL